MEALKQKAKEFLAVLARLDGTQQVTSETFDDSYLITFCPSPSDSSLHRLLPPISAEPTSSQASFVVVSKPPIKDADVTLADLSYNSDLVPDKRSLASPEKSGIAQFTVDEVCQVVCSLGHAPIDASAHTQSQSLHRMRLSSGLIYQPLTKDEARYILSLHSLALRECSTSDPSVPDVFVFSQSVGPGEQDVEVSLQGSRSTRTPSTQGHQMISAAAMKETDEGRCTPLSSGTSAHAVYEAGPGMDCEEGGAQVVAEVTWSCPKKVLHPPPVTASATLHVAATFGAPTSPLQRIYQELTYLSRYVLLTDKAVPRYLPESAPTQDGPFSLESFLSEYEKMATSSLEHSPESVFTSVSDVTLSSSLDDHSIINLRQITDFLEFLWEKLHTNMDQVQGTFQKVFELIMAKKVQPFLLRSNTSSLASLIRRILSPQDSSRHLQLEVKEALLSDNLVAHFTQLGLLKLAQDIRYVFASHRLLPRADLQDLTKVDSKPPAEAFFTLMCYYKALEVALVAELHFSIPGTALHPLTRTALHYFRENTTHCQEKCSPTFQLSLPPQSEGVKSIVALCQHLQPTIWRATVMEGKTEKLFVFSSTPLLYGQSLQFLDTTAVDSMYMYKVTTCYTK